MAASLASLSTLLLLFLLIFLHVGHSTPTSSATKTHKTELGGRRNYLALMEVKDDEEQTTLKPTPKKKPILLETKNQTKPSKPTTTTTTTNIKLNNHNKTLVGVTPKLKPYNSTKLPKLIKSNSTKNQFKSFNLTSNPSKSQKKAIDPSPKPKSQQQPSDKKQQQQKKTQNYPHPVQWLSDDEDSDAADVVEDLLAEFRGLPSQLLPDLDLISATSKTYISRANKGIADGVKPYVGNEYAATLASVASAAFLLLPLFLLTLLFHRLRSYLSLQSLLMFIQAYLGIYFATLAAAALAMGLEPLRFFYATSPASYAATQALQTLGYVTYLLVQLIHLVVVFSGRDGAAARALALAQMVVGLAVGTHYYAVVFHRVATGQPPRSNWRVHGMYAACFLVICALARVERRKNAYFPESGDNGKKS